MDLSDTRPKLKHNSVFFQVDGGTFLRNDETTFMLKGKSVYRWLSALSPHMNGEHTMEQLCDGLDPDQRNMVTRIVGALLERGFLKHQSWEDSKLLPDNVRHYFRSQIEFIDHYTDRPHERFKIFRESRLLLLGSGEVLIALAIALLRNGLKELFLAPTDQAEYYVQAIEPEFAALRQHDIEASVSLLNFDSHEPSCSLDSYNLVVCCADDGSLEEVLTLNRRCVREGLAFLPAVISLGQAMIGPFVSSRNGPCWLCAVMRLAANSESDWSAALWKRLALGDHLCAEEGNQYTSTARMVGNGVGFEIFKILTQCLAPETANGMILQNVETLETQRGNVLRHPLCPLDSQLDLAISTDHLLELVVGKCDRGLDRKELLQKCSQFIDPAVGVFKMFDDDKVAQIPLKTTRLVVGSPASPIIQRREITAYSVEHVLDARYAALREALAHYTNALPDSRGMISASLAELLATDKAAITARDLSTWSGALSFEQGSRIEWMPAFSLGMQRLCYVPAAAIYPHSSLNRLGVFERTCAGSGSELTFQDTLTAGLLSILGYEAVRDLIRGRGSVIALDPAALEAIDADTAFLFRSIKHFERTVAVRELVSESLLHIILVYTDNTSAPQISTIGVGLSGLDALKKALLPLVGRLQSFESEGKLPDTGDDLFPEFLPRFDSVAADLATSRLYKEATTAKQLEDYVHMCGRDILFVNTTTTDLWETGTFISGKVLLKT